MAQLKIEISKDNNFISESEIQQMQDKLISAQKALLEKTGEGNDFLGWVHLTSTIDEALITKIISCAEKIRKQSKVLVVIGIGGSYLGARAMIDALSHQFSGLLQKELTIVYAGNNLSEDYHADLLDLLDEKDYSVVVISKSGTTTEPAVAFRILKKHLEEKYGKEKTKGRIIAITDHSKGALKKVSLNEGYETFSIPDDVGGRYSVLTPVGLLPMAAAGIDILKMMDGAKAMEKICCSETAIKENPAMLYAAIRNVLYTKGKSVEILSNFQPCLQYFSEWWKQLYGESEGKKNKGIFPAAVSFTTDLHSMGQYIQEGQRNIFETIISVEQSKRKLQIPSDEGNLDGLNFIAGKNIQYVNQKAETGTIIAHNDGGVPIIKISVPIIDEKSLGELIYFFEFACGLSGYLLGVNPFDQPGVEAYKNNMFALLEKPGYENLTEEIKKRL
jgi:glucose-6-phosphate isomerase